MTDWGINRNGSNYSVPTEAAAIKAEDREAAQAPKAGEIWSRRNGKTGNTEYCLVIASAWNICVVAPCYDAEKPGRIQITGRTLCWIDPMRILYVYHRQSEMQYIKAIPESEMKAVKAAIAAALGIANVSAEAVKSADGETETVREVLSDNEKMRHEQAQKIVELTEELNHASALCDHYRRLYEEIVISGGGMT